MKRRPPDVKLREELLQMQRIERVRERAVEPLVCSPTLKYLTWLVYLQSELLSNFFSKSRPIIGLSLLLHAVQGLHIDYVTSGLSS